MKYSLITIAARSGKAIHIKKGLSIKIINTHGKQVIDTWAFNESDLSEYMSMEHSRASFLKLMPQVGDIFCTNKRNPILTLVKDTSPGIHDTIIAACDNERYQLLGYKGYHQNCSDNLSTAMKELNLKINQRGSPLNLFMNTPWTQAGTLKFDEPVTKAGDYVILQAEINAVIAFSACPQDILFINGMDRTPTEAHFKILKC